MSTRKLQSYLGSNAALAALSSQVGHIQELQSLWESLAPSPLAQMCKVSGLKDRVLVVYANSGAVAAKVRQLAPSVLEKLQKRGVEVTAILVRVQVRYQVRETKPIKTLLLGPAGTDSLRRLAGQLEESPLRQALERLLARHGRDE